MRVVGTRIPTVGEDRKIYSTADSTATANQTVFAVNYDEGKVACWLNGIRLVQGQDFTNTASGVGSQITLTSGIAANDYLEVVGYQGIYSGNALVEDRFVVGTNSTGSGGAYNGSAGDHTTVFPVANNTGDLVCVYRNGIKLVHTTDFVASPSTSKITLQNAAINADEITVHVIGILQHSNFVPSAGGAFTGNVTFGDNIKTIYGAGSDLQIYHDGSDSIIKDAGTGNLRIGADTDIVLGNAALTEVKAAFTSDGAASLYYDNSSKIQTTATGVNVDGAATVTGDLTVDTNTLKVDSSGNKVGIGASSGLSNNLHIEASSGDGGITIHSAGDTSNAVIFDANRSSADSAIGLNVAKWNGTTVGYAGFKSGNDTTNKDNGEFVIATGESGSVSEKLRLDKDGNVGIGTASVMSNFGSGRSSLAIKGVGSTNYSTLQMGTGGASANDQYHGLFAFFDNTTEVSRISSKRESNGSDAYLSFFTAPSGGGIAERMRISASGNVGIGITNPSVALHTHRTTGNNSVYVTTDSNTNDSAVSALWLAHNFSTSADWAGIIFDADDKLRINNSGSSNDSHLVITDAGNVGIGTATPFTTAGANAKLTINGHVRGGSYDLGYGSFSQTGSGAMTIVGHNAIKDPSSSNRLISQQNSWHSHYMRMYYTHGISFHTTASQVSSAGTEVYNLNNTNAQNNERLRITTGGDINVRTGNIVIGTAGKGIDFSAQTTSSVSGVSALTSSSSDYERLAHYEQGTWTPTITNATGYAYRGASYIRIGHWVWLFFYVHLSGRTSNSDGQYLGGFPFNVADRSANTGIESTGPAIWGNASSATSGMWVNPVSGGNNALIRHSVGSGSTDIQTLYGSDMDTDFYIQGSVGYLI